MKIKTNFKRNYRTRGEKSELKELKRETERTSGYREEKGIIEGGKGKKEEKDEPKAEAGIKSKTRKKLKKTKITQNRKFRSLNSRSSKL